MSWLGAGIGAVIGLTIGGPIGAAIGAWLGSSIGNKADGNVVNCPHCQQSVRVEGAGQWVCPHCNQSFIFAHHSEQVQMQNQTQAKQTIFFVALNSMLAKIAKADGRVSEEEISLLSNFYNEIGFDGEDRQAAIDIFNNAKDDKVSIYDYAAQYAQTTSLEMREMIYGVLWQVALADGELHPQEENILRRITAYLKISSQHYQRYHPNYQRQTPNEQLQTYYALFDATPSDSDEILKRKYRKKIAEYHPDKIQAQGLPEQFLKQATEQAAKINAAYDAIVAHRKR